MYGSTKNHSITLRNRKQIGAKSFLKHRSWQICGCCFFVGLDVLVFMGVDVFGLVFREYDNLVGIFGKIIIGQIACQRTIA